MYLINGSEVSKEKFNLPIEDLSVWRGDGVFEAIKIHNGYPFGIKLHIDRLKKSCHDQLFSGINFEEIKENIFQVAKEYDSGYVRILVLRGSDVDQHNIYIFHQKPITFPENFSLQSQQAPWHAGGDFKEENSVLIAKTTSYAYNVRHTRHAESNGFTDALLLNKDNIVLEGPTWSIGWIIGENVFVSDLELGILDSITRKYLLNFGEKNLLNVSSTKISINELYEVDSAFVMSTAKHGVFVNKIDEVEYEQSPLVKKIQNLFIEEVEKERNSIQT
jgi:branched-subunit amino acid aminotransferase/4-amino-4-deoxychorismate lyase